MRSNEVIRIYLLAISLIFFQGCGADLVEFETKCSEEGNHIELKQTRDGKFYRSVNIDNSGGASFNGFGYFKSATNLKHSSKIKIDQKNNVILFKSKKNTRALNEVDCSCSLMLYQFIEKHGMLELLEEG